MTTNRIDALWQNMPHKDVLISALRKLDGIAQQAKTKAGDDAGRNVIDPFTALFQMQFLGIAPEDWPKIERHRQIEKSLQNAIGDFHQSILGGLPGWINLGRVHVVDLVCREKKLIAEVKNKHNTLKASDQAELYDKLHDLVRKKGQEYAGYTAYYVEIIPKKPERYDLPFTPSDNTTGTRKPEDALIRRIDGASFYALATGHDDALRQLFHALPHAFAALGIANSSTLPALLVDYYSTAFGSS